MHTLLRRLSIAAAICTLIASSEPVVAQDPGPVTRPLSETNIPSTNRLPAPKPSARQGSDGRIVVSWEPIEGAVSYRMWRSVPPAPTAAVTLQNPQQTSYVDADVRTGSTYYYLVAAVNQAGIEGLRGGTTPVTAMISSSSSTETPPTVKATVTQQDPLRVYVSFYAADAVRYEIQRTLYSSPSADASQIDYARPLTVPLSSPSATNSPSSITDSLPSQPYARSVSYAVRAILTSGFIGPPGKADVLIPAATVTTTTGDTTTGGSPTGGTTTGGSTTGGTTSTTSGTITSSPTVVGSTTFTLATRATVTTGATTSLSAASGSAARWLSLNEAVASVDASGSVTGRSAGNTQIVALAASSDGSLRVVAIPLTVTP